MFSSFSLLASLLFPNLRNLALPPTSDTQPPISPLRPIRHSPAICASGRFRRHSPLDRSLKFRNFLCSPDIAGADLTMASVTSLDKDLRNLRLSRYTPQAAAEVRDWIEEVLQERLPSGDLLDTLKDGVALCK